MTTEEEQREKEEFAHFMALAMEIMRTDRDLLLQLRDLHLENKDEQGTEES